MWHVKLFNSFKENNKINAIIKLPSYYFNNLLRTEISYKA